MNEAILEFGEQALPKATRKTAMLHRPLHMLCANVCTHTCYVYVLAVLCGDWLCWPITWQICLLFRRLKPSQAQKEDETQVLLLTYCFNSICHWLASRKSVWSQWKQQCQLVRCNRSFNSLWSWNSFLFSVFSIFKKSGLKMFFDLSKLWRH